jgi:hypothetical protein
MGKQIVSNTSTLHAIGGRHARQPPKHPDGRPMGDRWLVWILAIVSIAAPVILLLCAYSIPKADMSWYGVLLAVRRGNFLMPAMLLCAETVRCWWSEAKVKRRSWGWVRITATFTCTVAVVICISATTIASLVPAKPEVGLSITIITSGSLSAALVFGTAAVWVSTSGGNK